MCVGNKHPTFIRYVDRFTLGRISLIPAAVIRQILVQENRQLDADDKAAMDGANRSRVEEAARLESISFEKAMERRKGFRYLY